jgi:hypothetical protein
MKGVSATVTAVVAVTIVVASTVLVVNVITPVMEQGKTLQRFNEAKNLLSGVDAAISELMYEAPGAKRTLKLSAREGQFIVSGADDSLKFKFDPGITLFEPGTRKKEGNLIITSGPGVKAYEQDVDGDGDTDLVLENAAVLFAINKSGNSTNRVLVNTTNFIRLMKNKVTGVNITPTSGIYIDEYDNSSYGQGYTELTSKGEYLTSASIRLVMNSSANIEYEALFTLGAGKDFIEMEVRHINAY